MNFQKTLAALSLSAMVFLAACGTEPEEDKGPVCEPGAPLTMECLDGVWMTDSSVSAEYTLGNMLDTVYTLTLDSDSGSLEYTKTVGGELVILESSYGKFRIPGEFNGDSIAITWTHGRNSENIERNYHATVDSVLLWFAPVEPSAIRTYQTAGTAFAEAFYREEKGAASIAGKGVAPAETDTAAEETAE